MDFLPGFGIDNQTPDCQTTITLEATQGLYRVDYIHSSYAIADRPRHAYFSVTRALGSTTTTVELTGTARGLCDPRSETLDYSSNEMHDRGGVGVHMYGSTHSTRTNKTKRN